MNQYRCETCNDISCECNPQQNGIQFSPNWIFSRRYGCASHSSIQSERDVGLTILHNWFENYCEGNEEPDLWMAFIKAERALRQSKQDGKS
jgi:hypothetical protein